MSVKQRILQAGVALLHDEGYAALSQPRIAKAAGVSQSHLTYYFPTRAELLLALAEHSVAQLQQTAGGAPQPAALVAGGGFLPRVRMLLSLVLAADQDAALRPTVAQLVQQVRAMLRQWLAAAGYAPSEAQLVALHGSLIGLGLLNLGRQSAASAAEIETGLQAMLALLPRAQQAGEAGQ